MFTRSITFARVRVWAHRVDLSRWALVGALASLAAIGTGTAVSKAEARAAAYGSPVSVYVLAANVEAGTILDGSMVSRSTRPRTLIPPSAVQTDPEGARTSRALITGQVVVDHDVTDPELIPGLLGVAIPHNPETLRLAVGDHVALLAVTIDHPGATVLAARAPLIDVTPLSVIVAVDAATAGDVAWALANGLVSVSLAP